VILNVTDHFEICETESGTYAPSLSLSPSNGQVTQTVYVRLKEGLNANRYAGESLTLTSGSVSRELSLTGEVTGMASEMVTKTFTFNEGWCWWSTDLDITLDQLKDAIADALGTTGTATIKSKERSVSYVNGIWRGTLTSIDITQMQKIKTNTSCEITLTGIPVNPTERTITIHSNANWIAFPLNESMSVNDVFEGFSTNGDIIKSKDVSSTFNGSNWRGTLHSLEPGNGYIYQSKADHDKFFTFPTNN
jgi:hypothetical protein